MIQVLSYLVLLVPVSLPWFRVGLLVPRYIRITQSQTQSIEHSSTTSYPHTYIQRDQLQLLIIINICGVTNPSLLKMF